MTGGRRPPPSETRDQAKETPFTTIGRLETRRSRRLRRSAFYLETEAVNLSKIDNINHFVNKTTMKNREQIIEAAIGVISRYGVKRTTMSDVAAEANIVRQTLYNLYANKEDLLRAMMRHIGEQSVAAIRSEAEEADGLAAKLNIFFLHFVVKPYEWLQSSPDARDIVDGFNDAARDELAKSYENHRTVLQELLKPYAGRIEQAGLKLPALADIIQTAAKGAKSSARDKRHLNVLLDSLKIMVLTLVGEEPPRR